MPTKDSPPLPPSEYALKLPNDVDGNIEYVPAFTLNQLHERDAIWQAKLNAAREAQAQAVPMTEIDFQDDDALRFAQRVLESDAPPSDRKAARDGLVAIRTRVRKAHAAKKGTRHE